MIDINGRYDHYPFSEQLPINILYLACRTGEILFGTFQANGGKCESHAVGEAPKKTIACDLHLLNTYLCSLEKQKELCLSCCLFLLCF